MGFLETLRVAELKQTEQLFQRYGKKECHILEIGSGTGWQAKMLNDMGYRVEGIDLPASVQISNHARARIWPVTDYDGINIPFPDGCFDIVYSSNVLEHVTDLEELDAEIHRVLAGGGCAVHLLPNPVWRLSSLLSYYPAQVVDLFRFIKRRRTRNAGMSTTIRATRGSTIAVGSKRFLAKMTNRIFPPTHGSEGTPVSELKRFSKNQWDGFFKSHNWEILEYGNNGIWATGDSLAGHALPITVRRRIGKLVGGIAHIYVLKSQTSKISPEKSLEG